jgi:predicted pyridoxine 5'-phosphate oxidase superfamily flavin-nucleotide-binding protein
MGHLTRTAGSAAELRLQERLGTTERARRFYDRQVLDRLNAPMIEFVERQQLMFVATSDSTGACDNSLRAGPPGFIEVLDGARLAYPEYRGNGVLASLANLSENPQVGLILIDFLDDVIGLHVNGRATVVEHADFRREHPGLDAPAPRGRRPEQWVVVDVEEAYIHCSKHIPRFRRLSRTRFWGWRRRPRRNGGDFFTATSSAPDPVPRRAEA